jgi:hypothetical protein
MLLRSMREALSLAALLEGLRWLSARPSARARPGRLRRAARSGHEWTGAGTKVGCMRLGDSRTLPSAEPNVRVEAGPTVLRLAREAHHVPRRFAGQVQCRWASPRTRG